MKIKYLKKSLPLFLLLTLVLSGFTGCWGSKHSDSSPTSASSPPTVSTDCFVDNYTNNTSGNLTVSSNSTIRPLSKFLKIFTPGSDCTTGYTILDETTHNANIQKVIDVTTSRTSSEAEAAYYDDRRNQSYSIISGLGPYADDYITNSGATTTIVSIPDDALSVKYEDSGTDYGATSSTLGSVAALVKTLRGNYSSTTPTKKYYLYQRPFRWSSSVVAVPVLVPVKSSTPATDYGFPSGHTNAGYLTA